MTLLRFGTLPLLATALAACSAAEAPGGTVFADSAGVTVATAEIPLWTPENRWRVAKEPRVQIGLLEGPDEYLFTDLVGAVRLGDGRIVVADGGTLDLRYFDPSGSFLLRTGADGEGPGEFRRLDFIGVLPGDSLVTYDGRLARIQIFNAQGVFSRSLRVESPWPGFFPDRMTGVMGGARVVLQFGGFGTEVPDGIVRWPPELIATMDLQTGDLDSLFVVPGTEAAVETRGGGGYTHGTVVFGKDYEFAAALDRVAVISTDTFAVRVLGPDGSTRLIMRRPVSPEPATQAHADTLIRNILDMVFPAGTDPGSDDAANLRRSWERVPRAATLPLLRSVHFDADGNAWVEPYFHMGGTPRPFQVFSAEGSWLGEVALPPGLDREVHPRRAPSMQIGSDFFLGVWTDGLGVQYVRLYGIEKG